MSFYSQSCDMFSGQSPIIKRNKVDVETASSNTAALREWCGTCARSQTNAMECVHCRGTLNGPTNWIARVSKPAVAGVSPDEPIVTNSQGGKQARAMYAFHLLDTDAMLSIARVMQEGSDKYERDNWRKIPAEEHMNHMLIHWYAWIKGDRSDDHLAHMFTRAMMCYACAHAEDDHADH